MTLTVKRAGADEYGTRLKMLLAGEPGAGKTRMSSTFPNVIYANAEGGLMSVADRQPPHVDITNTEKLFELQMALAQTPKVREQLLGVPVQTVIVDTLDNVQRMYIAERLIEQKKEAMTMPDWGWLGDQMRSMIRAFRNLELHVIFCCHIRTVEDSESGAVLVKPSLQGAMQDEIASYVDVAGLLRAAPVTRVVDGESTRVLSRTLQTFPDARHAWLKDRSGKLPMEFEIDLTSDYSRLNKTMFPAGAVAPTETVSQEPPPPPPKPPKLTATKAPTQPPVQAPAPVPEAQVSPTPPEDETVAAASDARPVAERAGTKINHKVAKKFSFNRDNKTIEAGTFDPSQGLYQMGGDVNKLVLWKDRLLGLGIAEWDAVVAAGVTTIEVIDSGKNQCWRTDIASAVMHGRRYDAGAGPRYGIATDAFDIYDVAGNLVTERGLPIPEAPDKVSQAPGQPAADAGSLPAALVQLEAITSTDVEAAAFVDPGAQESPIPPTEIIAESNGKAMEPCSDCGGAIETEDQLDLSKIRFRAPLCRKCFVAKKGAKR